MSGLTRTTLAAAAAATLAICVRDFAVAGEDGDDLTPEDNPHIVRANFGRYLIATGRAREATFDELVDAFGPPSVIEEHDHGDLTDAELAAIEERAAAAGTTDAALAALETSLADAGLAVVDVHADGTAELIAVTPEGEQVLRDAADAVPDSVPAETPAPIVHGDPAVTHGDPPATPGAPVGPARPRRTRGADA